MGQQVPDVNIVSSYISAFTAVRTRSVRPVMPMDTRHSRFDSAFSTAIAVFLGATEFEQQLKDQLDERYWYFHDNQDDVPLVPAEEFHSGAKVQDIKIALDYMAALSVAWLHAERQTSLGRPVTIAGFPVVPQNVLAWPVPTVPQIVLQKLSEVRRVFLGKNAVPPNQALDVFSNTVSVHVPALQQPLPPSLPAGDRPDIDVDVIVPNGVGDVLVSNVLIRSGDRILIEADSTHMVSPGGIFPQVGPEGYSDVVSDINFPVFSSYVGESARKYALLGRINGWFVVGARKDFVYVDPSDLNLSASPRQLYLGINEDVSERGSGSFYARVRVWHAGS